jgi:hypothetical protein
MRDIDPISGNPCGIQFGPEPPAAKGDQCPLCDLSGPHAHTVDELRDLERKAAFLAAKLGVPSQQSKLDFERQAYAVAANTVADLQSRLHSAELERDKASAYNAELLHEASRLQGRLDAARKAWRDLMLANMFERGACEANLDQLLGGKGEGHAPAVERQLP